MIDITNNGQEIIATNYWLHAKYGKGGLAYLSGNAGAWRLLLPANHANEWMEEMKTGKFVLIERSIRTAGHIDLVFDDGSKEPFSLTIHRQHQVDRKLENGEYPFIIYAAGLGMTHKMTCKIKL